VTIFAGLIQRVIKEQKTSPLKNRRGFGCFPKSGGRGRTSKRRCTIGCGANLMDNFNKEKRSQIMGKVRSHGNASTELKALRILRRGGVKGWRRHLAIFGRPDFAFTKARIALFIDGCFWHGCPRCYKRPKSSAAFWRRKLANNMKRDLEVRRQLLKRGWKVVRLWECQLKSPAHLLKRIKGAI